jgi:hypothetical protein
LSEGDTEMSPKTDRGLVVDVTQTRLPTKLEPEGYEEWRERETNYLEFLEDATSYPLIEQDRILEHILSKNANTEYVRRYQLNGATDINSFREHLPVSDYEMYKEYINRIFHGDTSPILTADPVVQFMLRLEFK